MGMEKTLSLIIAAQLAIYLSGNKKKKKLLTEQQVEWGVRKATNRVESAAAY